ncbi:TetR/AcrR family transcriptional regulator [Niveibacterium sp. 24ML]|uniref:TetR/AcrR family transcriptional regulator n=1 Tax=Niveibacterium sp. 24ML TaxID=2985512 RepID=UPI0022707B9D|nr:TetR/AcrR family transcriptional regulator [Niveibacterium sp. 24ML]MCX9155321.1 TetR/AcrR family transcriptional regulator [Niveibacterium sp. 24ML]
MDTASPERPSFKQRQFEAREDAILDAAHQLIATKGYDLTTVDEVANAVGIAKASLYKHFASKEALATAAMLRTLRRTLAFVDQLSPDLNPIQSMRALLDWALRLRLAGGLPTLPSGNSVLREALSNDPDYSAAVVQLSGRLMIWIHMGKAFGLIRPDLPDEVVLLSLYARSCDPTVDFLKESGSLSDDQIVASMLTIYFDGIAPQPPKG